MENKHRTTKLSRGWLVTLAVVLSIVVISFIVNNYQPEINLLLHPVPGERAKLLELMREHGLFNSILLLALVALFNAIPGMSNSVVCIFVGLCYGPWLGFMINWLGNICGNCLVISLMNHIDLSKRMKSQRVLDLLLNQKHPLIGLTIGFMIPFIPSILVNYASSQMHIEQRRYLAMLFVGMAPTSFLYAFGGDAIFKGDFKRFIPIIVALLVIFACYYVIRKFYKQHKDNLAES